MVSTRRSGPGQEVRSVPEPALRPTEAQFPNRCAARRARVYVECGPSENVIVIRDPRGRERRIPTGPGGVRRVVLEPSAGTGVLIGGSLALLGENDQVLARLPRLYWDPGLWDESVHGAGLAAEDDAAFAVATRLPVSDNRHASHDKPDPHDARPAGRAVPARPASRGNTRRGTDVGIVGYRVRLPGWFIAVRAMLAAAAACLLISVLLFVQAGGGTGAVYAGLVLACAAAVLAQPLLSGALIARAVWLDRASEHALGQPMARLAPRPSQPRSRRFLRTASVRVFDSDVVATDEVGEERWMPRSGPTGVTELMRVTVRSRPDRLELRTPDGRPRAVLPWEDWFAGAGGEQTLADFAAAAGLPLRTTAGHHIPRDKDTSWGYRPLQFPSASAAARYPQWTGLPGAASVAIPITYGIFTALLSVGFLPAFVLALLAVVLTAGPWLARRLARRRLVRPP